MTTGLFPGRDHHVRRSGTDYSHQLLALLPQGQAWPKEPASTLYKVCRGLADYWGFVDQRAAFLLESESDPRWANDLTYADGTRDGLLSDWERAWGLPDPCFPTTTTIAERRRMLVLYMTWLGGQSRAYFQWLMEFIGYQIEEIGEFAPFMCGISRVGDTREVEIVRDASGIPALNPNGTIKKVPKGNFRWYIGPAEQRFSWTASVGAAQLMWFRAASGQAGVDHHLEIGIPEDLNCLLNRWKPAHTDLVLDFHQLAYGSPMAGTP